MTRRRTAADDPRNDLEPAFGGSAAWETPEWMKHPAPCTPEENYRALQLVKGVLGGEITVEHAKRVLNEMFLGREIEL